MNFSNQFNDIWGTRFPGVHPPTLNCLKADQFGSLLEQKQAFEFEESKRCAGIEELKQQLNHETFIADFVHKCIQKLGAVSQVFNEIDQSDSKSSSSSGTTSRHPGSSGSPTLSTNGCVQQNKFLSVTSSSNFPLFPQCIASSLIQSATPLLAAAAATSNASFLLPSSLAPFSGAESIKSDPDPLPIRPSDFILTAADRSSYEAISRLTASSHSTSLSPPPLSSSAPTSTHIYNNPLVLSHVSHNPFTVASLSPSCPTLCSNSSFSLRGPASLLDKSDSLGPPIDHTTSSDTQAAQAAAAVAAAFGLGFPSHAHQPIRSNVPYTHLNKSADENSCATTSDRDINHSNNSLHLFNGKNLSSSTRMDRPFRCGICPRGFAVKAGLVQHMRTHTDERPYPCPHCGRAFRQKIQLTTHMRVHSGERPYGCRLCGKLFRQQSHVVQHLRTHTGEKPHKCFQCGKAFRQKYSLISHQRRMCRNRASSNPIAAGMTMWISPGVDGDTCNLVKEFSPTRIGMVNNSNNNNVAGLHSPSSSTLSGTPVAVPATTTSAVQSPFSPYLTSPPASTVSSTPTLQATGQFHNHRGPAVEEAHHHHHHPHDLLDGGHHPHHLQHSLTHHSHHTSPDASHVSHHPHHMNRHLQHLLSPSVYPLTRPTHVPRVASYRGRMEESTLKPDRPTPHSASPATAMVSEEEEDEDDDEAEEMMGSVSMSPSHPQQSSTALELG